MSQVTIEYSAPKVTISASPPKAEISLGTPVVKEYVDAPAYTGAYEVTPTAETQILDTAGKRMTQPVVINPIPSNWGRISYDGSILTVS